MALFAKQTHAVGDVTVTRVEEQCGPGFAPDFLFPDWTPDVLERHRNWMVPDFFDEAQGKFIASIHTWVVRTKHHVILIDSCAGNHKNRPQLPRFHQLDLPFLNRLRAAGVAPQDVDYVLCTHLHADHCGWNTRLDNGRWVPTFPNAKYVFSKAEQQHWSGAAGQSGFNAGVYEDSVLPVIESGQMELIDGLGQIGAGLFVEPTPGHSIGHVAFRLESGGEEGVFSGDIMHQPLQIYYPHWNSCFCEDQALARQSRAWVLEHCAEHRSQLFPAHFAGSFTGHVERKGDEFIWNPRTLERV
ncbi:glyoxylase-like metal-dependent hydrolase (beta-lactamase superfamily II) [Nitrobacteraceae bacterium AZCC 2146]